MTRQQYIISRKTNILELGRTLGNISVAFRKKLYKTIEEVQADLDAFMA